MVFTLFVVSVILRLFATGFYCPVRCIDLLWWVLSSIITTLLVKVELLALQFVGLCTIYLGSFVLSLCIIGKQFL